MTYPFLLETVWHPPLAFEEASDPPLPAELELQALWFSGAFGRDFRTTDGRRVNIIQFGEWNRSAGPDFTQTAVEIEGTLKAGDIELDPDAQAWETHGHSTNPAFRNVVLHVIFQADSRTSFTRTSEHREVPQIVISRMHLGDALALPPREVAIARPGRCLTPLKGMPASAVERLLEESARHRAQTKARRFLCAADAHGRDAALFQATAETLGYRGNALAMKLLAQRAPIAALKTAEDAAEAILFGTAGFLSPQLHELAPPDTRDYLRTLWDDWWKNRARFEVAPERAIPWKTHGQRPANHPHRRVGALSAIAAHWPAYRRLALAKPFRAKPLVDFLHSLKHPLWSSRHTLTSAPTGGPVAVFGRAQALELVANHLVPLALHEGSTTWRDYHKLRHSATNEKIRRCAIRLFGSESAAKPWTRRLCHHQALLQIYHDFCLQDTSDCRQCPFPEQLAQWR